jgi:hypothetical protein
MIVNFLSLSVSRFDDWPNLQPARLMQSTGDCGRPGGFGTSPDKRLIPLYIPDHLREKLDVSPGLLLLGGFHPKAHFFVVLSEYDSLRYQSNEWIKKMRDEGMRDRLKVFRAFGLPHGFANLPKRWLRIKAFTIKMEAYAEMRTYWDQVVSGKKPEERETIEREKVSRQSRIKSIPRAKSLAAEFRL